MADPEKEIKDKNKCKKKKMRADNEQPQGVGKRDFTGVVQL